ncbi:hypothetical protein EF912_09730 [Streptomyces sp. WAC07061]|uniref:hypothetical protein n=1 Tax=Streptomyces sp. WAC07061 TaxID=2487410 RepID=UPI000F77B6F0|nr:hypothetical protein [Streptomyces sp. WAC07061]RSS60536.1 hypothetical protein EF912_09730 [Streptomyces sp. WAC07061]
MADVARGTEGEQGLPARLKAGLMDNSAWERGPPGELAGRMVGQVLRALTTPPCDAPESWQWLLSVTAGQVRSFPLVDRSWVLRLLTGRWCLASLY